MTISDRTAISKLNGYAKHTSLKIKHIYLKLLLFISETPFTFQKTTNGRRFLSQKRDYSGGQSAILQPLPWQILTSFFVGRPIFCVCRAKLKKFSASMADFFCWNSRGIVRRITFDHRPTIGRKFARSVVDRSTPTIGRQFAMSVVGRSTLRHLEFH